MSNAIHVTLKNISKETAEKYILEKKEYFKSYDDYVLNFSKKISPPDGIYTREWLKKNWGSGSNGYDCKVKPGKDDTLIIDFNCDTAPPVEIIEKMKDECDFEFSSYSGEDFKARQITFINGVDRKTLVWDYDIKDDEYVVKSLLVDVKDENYHIIYHNRHSMYPKKQYDDEFEYSCSYSAESVKTLFDMISRSNSKTVNVLVPDLLISLNIKAEDVVQVLDKAEERTHQVYTSDIIRRLGTVFTEEDFRDGYVDRFLNIAEQITEGKKIIFTDCNKLKKNKGY